MSILAAAQIAALWIANGGNPQAAMAAAKVALDESGGNTDSTNYNTNGTVDRGLWQINSIHGAQSSYDPNVNAKAAIAISGNGQSWKAWCSQYSDRLCGTQGGVYVGPGAGPTTGTKPSPGSGPLGSTQNGFQIKPPKVGGITGDLVNPIISFAFSITETLVGVGIILVGTVILIKAWTPPGVQNALATGATAVPGVGQAVGFAKGTKYQTGRRIRSASVVRTGRGMDRAAPKDRRIAAVQARAADRTPTPNPRWQRIRRPVEVKAVPARTPLPDAAPF